MDLPTLAGLYDGLMDMWLKKPHGTVFHLSKRSTDWILLLGQSGGFKWRAKICIGSRGGISCGFDFIDDRDQSLPSADRIETCSPLSVLLTDFPFGMLKASDETRESIILAAKKSLELFDQRVASGEFSEKNLIQLKNIIQRRPGSSGPLSFQGGGCNPR